MKLTDRQIGLLITIFIISIIILILVSYQNNGIELDSVEAQEQIIKASTLNTETFVYKSNVYIIKGNDFELTETSITFFKNYNFKIGQILLGEEAPGFMIEITKILPYSNNKLELLTTKVDIDKVFETIKTSQTFTLPDTYQLQQLSAESSKNFNIPINKNFNIDNVANVNIIGSLTISPKVTIDVDVGFTGINYLKLVSTCDCNLTFTSVVTSTKYYSKSVENQVYPAPGVNAGYVVPLAYGVWITINPSIILSLNFLAKASFTYDLLTTFKTTSPYKIGLEYLKNQPIRQINQLGTWTPTFTTRSIVGNAEIRFIPAILFNLNFLLWGFIGPLFGLKIYLNFTTQAELCGNKPITKIISMIKNNNEIVLINKQLNNQLNNIIIPTNICLTHNEKIGVTAVVGGSLFGNNIYFEVFSNEWLL